MYPMTHQRSSLRPFTENSPSSQRRRQLCAATRPISTPSQAIARARADHLPRPCQNPVRFYPSSRLKQIHPLGRRTRWRLRGQPQMGEDAGDDGWFFNGRDELELSTTVRAMLDVDIAMSIGRFNNCAQRMRPCALPAGVWAQSSACAGAVITGGTGTTALRSFAFGASTP